VEPQLEDPIGELAAEAVPMGVLPLPVHDLEGDVLVRRAGVEPQDPKVLVVEAGLEEVLRGRALVDQVGVEDVELVTLDNFGWGVVEVVMGLIVFVPLEARVDPVEEARFPGAVFVRPEVHLPGDGELHAELGLIGAHALLRPAHEGLLGTLAVDACQRSNNGGVEGGGTTVCRSHT